MTESAAGPALIRVRRKRLGLTQADLAKKIGVGTRQVMRYESADSQPSEEVAAMLAKHLGGSTEDYRSTPLTEPPSHYERELERVRVRNRDLTKRLEELEALVGEFLARHEG